MQYEWRTGARLSGDAQEIGMYLDALSRKHGGRLSAENVVADAKRRASPLRRYFQWNDGDAARLYREMQARWLIAGVILIKDNAPAVRAFVRTTVSPDGPYAGIEDAMRDRELRVVVLDRAKGELASWRQRNKSLVEFARVFDAIDEVVA